MLGQWLADIRDPFRCPAIQLGGQYLKGAPTYAIDAFITSLRDNLCARVLRQQNINFSNGQVRRLLDILPTTYIYVLNIGEMDLDRDTRQLLCSVIPRSHLVQIFLKNIFDLVLRRRILHLLELNRPKVAAFRSRLGEPPLPDHVDLMWKRLKSGAHVHSLSRKRPAESMPAVIPNEDPSLPPSKKPRMTKTSTVSTAAKAKKQRSSKPSPSPSFPSSTQRLLDTYFASTTVPTLDPTHAVIESITHTHAIMEPTT